MGVIAATLGELNYGVGAALDLPLATRNGAAPHYLQRVLNVIDVD